MSNSNAGSTRAIAPAFRNRYRQVIVLAVVTPIVAELLSSSAPPRLFFVPWILALFVLFYGSSAVLIRELAERWQCGWAGILLMGAAFGILQEGCATRAFFDPAWRSLGPLVEQGRWAGVNWIWMFDAILYHATFSAAIPILLTYQFFPAAQNQTWLSRTSLCVVAAMFVLAVTVFVRAGSKYPAPKGYLAGCWLAVAAMTLLARRVRVPGFERSRGDVAPLWFGLLGFAATAGLVTQIYVIPRYAPTAVTAVALIVLATLTGFLLLRWTSAGAWTRAQQFGLVSGALGCFGLMDILQEFNRTRSDNPAGISLVGLFTLIGLLFMARQFRRTNSSVDLGSCLAVGPAIPHQSLKTPSEQP
jgi:hypothetical protein